MYFWNLALAGLPDLSLVLQVHERAILAIRIRLRSRAEHVRAAHAWSTRLAGAVVAAVGQLHGGLDAAACGQHLLVAAVNVVRLKGRADSDEEDREDQALHGLT